MQQLMDGYKCPDPVTAESQPAREREPHTSSGSIPKSTAVFCVLIILMSIGKGALLATSSEFHKSMNSETTTLSSLGSKRVRWGPIAVTSTICLPDWT